MPQENATPATLGRVVLVRLFDGGQLGAEAPAIVNGVEGDILDVYIMPRYMDGWPVSGLVYAQEDEVDPAAIDESAPGVWRWMPYQLGAHAAAAKTES